MTAPASARPVEAWNQRCTCGHIATRHRDKSGSGLAGSCHESARCGCTEFTHDHQER